MVDKKIVKKTMRDRVEDFIDGLDSRLYQLTSAIDDAKSTLGDCERELQNAISAVEEFEYGIDEELIPFIREFEEAENAVDV